MKINVQLKAILACCIIIHVLTYSWAFRSGHINTKDSVEYIQQSVNIVRHHTWYSGDLSKNIDPALYSQRPPGYGLFISATRLFGFPWFTLIIQQLLSFLSLLIALACMRKIYGKTVPLVIPVMVFILFPLQFIYADMIMAEILFEFLLMCCLGSVILLDNPAKKLIISSVFFTSAMLVKPLIWLMPFVLLPVVFLNCLLRRRNYSVLFFFILPFIVITVMLYRNYNLTGVSEYSSISRKLLLNYNLPALLNSVEGKQAAGLLMDSIEANTAAMNYSTKTAFIDKVIYQVIIDHPLAYALQHLKGAILFFMDSGRWEINYFLYGNGIPSGWKSYDKAGGIVNYIKQFSVLSLLYLFIATAINLLLLISFLRFTTCKAINKSCRFIIAFAVLWFALLTGPSASARFRLPVFTVLLITLPSLYLKRNSLKQQSTGVLLSQDGIPG